jgi:hypothetical protein
MHNPRYIVASTGASWKIVRGGPRGFAPYPTKTQAVCAAIEFAERQTGAEVLVQHEDGYVQTEWTQGQDQATDKSPAPAQPRDLEEPDEIGPRGGYGGAGEDQEHPEG